MTIDSARMAAGLGKRPDNPTPPHEHDWRPVAVGRTPRSGSKCIYALCPCGEARKFRVRP